MRLILVSALAALSVIALSGQAPEGKKGGGGPPKNLKVLPSTMDRAQVVGVMRNFTAALGVQCTYCHVQGQFDSDDNPKKGVARMMMTMVRQINMNFPDGKQHVTCYTCHRGAEEPLTAPPAGAGDTKQ
ncbi:MAG TPA: c-type cytochrome [Bryobacteraceae bacterium]|nr:c-type cytochrome [Bryobacteraceae bacterium]